MKLINENNAVDSFGNKYHVHRRELANYSGWNLIDLHGQKEIMEKITAPLRKSVGVGVVGICVFFGLIVFFLFMKANTDIIQRKKAEEELMLEKTKLQDALLNVKELSGLLPICASCKNIRDDKGYWNNIESYISNHSKADFTHSICPDCAKKLYPDYPLYD